MFYVLTSVTMYSYYGKKIVYSCPYADELAASSLTTRTGPGEILKTALLPSYNS